MNGFTFYNELTGPGLLDKKISLQSPVVLPTGSVGRPIRIQCTQVQVSDRIPNIFDAAPFGMPFNNTMLRVGTNTVAYTLITLPMGLYLDATIINAAVNSAINSLGWWNNPSDPGIVIGANSVIDRFYIKLDSTKLKPAFGAQLKLDLRQTTTNSTLWYTLGYDATTELIADGIYESPHLPQLETQGTACIIELDIAPPRIFSNDFRRVIAEVSFAGKLTPSDSIWPQGAQISPPFNYAGNRSINTYQVTVTTRKGASMIFMGGILTFTIIFL